VNWELGPGIGKLGNWGQTPFRANGVRLQFRQMGADARRRLQIREMESDPNSRKWCLTPIPPIPQFRQFLSS